MENKKYQNYRCNKCHCDLYFKANTLICENCDSNFPIIGKTIIFKDNALNYLANAYIQYKLHIKDLNEIILAFKKNKNRIVDVNKLEKDIKKNVAYFQLLIAKIAPELSIDSFEKSLHLKKRIPYLTDLEYLKRDWSRDEENEDEIEVILKYISCFKEHNIDRDSCLVLGAGAGRLMYELKKEFKSIYGVDSSFTMVNLYYDLCFRDIEFSILNTKNVIKADDFVKSFKVNKINNDAKEIEYSVSDAKNLPYKNNFFSVITSIYFTDVIELPLYIEEVYRVLKVGGVFIHFGPLEYHFKNQSHMYSADEIKKIFTDNGFNIIEESFVETEHKGQKNILSRNLYNNWFFIAKKKEIKLSRFSVLILEEGTQFVSEKTYYMNTWQDKSYLKTSRGEVFEGANLINEFLKKVDGISTILQSLSILELELGQEFDIDGFIDKINYLIKIKVVKIKS